MNHRPLRVAIWHYLPSGGGKRALFDQIRGLVGRGHEVEVWCPSTADRSFLPIEGLAPEHHVPLDRPETPRGRVARRLAPYRDVVFRLDAMDRHCRACAEQIEAGGFDLLLAHPCTQFRSTPIGRHVRLPSLLYLQEPYRWFYEALPRLPWLALPPVAGRPSLGDAKAFLKDLVAVQGMRAQARDELAWAEAFDAILVNSFYSRESVLRAYGLDARVCYLGIDTDAFRPVGLAKGPYVVGLGGLYIGKGIEFAVDAVAAAGGARLDWVGNFSNPEYVDRLGDRARARGVRFESHVMVPHDRLLELLGGAAAMIYTPRLEPFGYAPLEANACGTFAVAVAEAGVRESIQDGVNGGLVDSRDPEALGEKLRPLLADLGLAAELGRAARRHVERRWGLGPAIDRLEAELFRALHRRSPAGGRDPGVEGAPVASGAGLDAAGGNR